MPLAVDDPMLGIEEEPTLPQTEREALYARIQALEELLRQSTISPGATRSAEIQSSQERALPSVETRLSGLPSPAGERAGPQVDATESSLEARLAALRREPPRSTADSSAATRSAGERVPFVSQKWETFNIPPDRVEAAKRAGIKEFDSKIRLGTKYYTVPPGTLLEPLKDFWSAKHHFDHDLHLKYANILSEAEREVDKAPFTSKKWTPLENVNEEHQVYAVRSAGAKLFDNGWSLPPETDRRPVKEFWGELAKQEYRVSLLTVKTRERVAAR